MVLAQPSPARSRLAHNPQPRDARASRGTSPQAGIVLPTAPPAKLSAKERQRRAALVKEFGASRPNARRVRSILYDTDNDLSNAARVAEVEYLEYQRIYNTAKVLCCKRKGKKTGWLVFTLGLLLSFLVNPFLDFLSYNYAPQSLLAPLAGLSIMWNAVLAPLMLNEKLQQKDAAGVFIICLGCSMVGVGAAKTSPATNSVDEVLAPMYSMRFLVYLILELLFMAVLCLCIVLPKYECFHKGAGPERWATTRKLASVLRCCDRPPSLPPSWPRPGRHHATTPPRHHVTTPRRHALDASHAHTRGTHLCIGPWLRSSVSRLVFGTDRVGRAEGSGT